MGLSLVQIQRDLILQQIRNTQAGANAGGWKVVVVDQDSRRLIDNVVREDDILELRVTNIEQIESKRQRNPDTDALYILSPEPHIVDCLMSDLDKGRYAAYHILWTGILPSNLRTRLTSSRASATTTLKFSVLNIDFSPRESHLAVFRDPYSFPVLYNPACNDLVQKHVAKLSEQIMSVCIALGEYPTIRFYRPRNPTHEASVLSQMIAESVQNELDAFMHWNPQAIPPSNRPPGALYILDRTMDLFAPFLHEFTYQAMAHDLLPIQEGDKVTFRMKVNEGRADEEVKDAEISEKDKVWVDYRHLHMKDTIERLMADFEKFIQANPQFADVDDGPANLSTIKDMMAGLPQFQEGKEAYNLHLTMAQDCMNIFGEHKLADIAAVEQTLAIGLDEDYKKPKNLGDQLIRLLDEETVVKPDRIRLIILYILYKNGLIDGDIRRLLLHAQLPVQEQGMIGNLELLGARVLKGLKDTKLGPSPLFPKQPGAEDEIPMSRFEPMLKGLLNEHIKGTLDQNVFPYLKPDQAPAPNDPSQISSASLRSAKPTWAKSKLSAVEPRQRIIVFMAGGATYSEARACYEISEQTSRDAVLVTSHMITPGLFLQQVGDLSADRRTLGLPQDRPPKRAPAHVFEDDTPPRPPPQKVGPTSGGLPSRPIASSRPVGMPAQPQPPVAQMGAMKLNGGDDSKKSSKKDKYGDDGEKKKKKKKLWG